MVETTPLPEDEAAAAHGRAEVAATPGRPKGLSVFSWYIVGHVCWSVGQGLQIVLFPYLVADVLAKPPFYVGLAQTLVMLPSLVLMLVGGATADQSELRGYLFRLYFFGIVPPLGMAILVAGGWLSYPLLIAYGLTMASLTAFVLPARDSLLTVVTPPDRPQDRPGHRIERAVALSFLAMYIGQSAGMVISGMAAVIGIALIFAGHALAIAGGAYSVSRLPPSPPVQASVGLRQSGRDILAGISQMWRSPVVRPAVIATYAISVALSGPYFVILPTLLSTEYGGGAHRYAITNIIFWIGTITANLLLLRMGRVRRRGRAFIIGYFGGTMMMFALSMTLPFWLFCTFMLFWGLGSGVGMTMARTMVQEHAPDAYRARILSLLELGSVAGGPLSAFAFGLLADALGPHGAAIVPAVAMIGVLAYLRFGTPFWRYGQDEVPEAAPPPDLSQL